MMISCVLTGCGYGLCDVTHLHITVSHTHSPVTMTAIVTHNSALHVGMALKEKKDNQRKKENQR